MPVAGGPKITKTGILLDVDAADKTSYPGSGTTWTNNARLGDNNGTLNNISFDSTDSKGALIFTGSNTYVDFGNIGDLSSAWSFQVAFKPAPTSSGDAYTILSYTSGSDTGSLTFKLDYSSSTQEVILSTFSTASATAETVHAFSASVASGSWNIVHGTFGNSMAALYVNGLGQAYQPTTGSSVGYNASNQLYAGGTYGLDSGFYTGSMTNVTVNNADLGGLDVNKNYNAIATRFSLPVRRPIVTDADAFNFVEVAGISDETQAAAINTLVLGMKSSGVWEKVIAVYPFVGGTAYSHKWNLKDPRDSDDAYRLLFYGGWTHSTTGILPNGSNTYADTRWGVNILLPTIPTLLENIHQGVYPRTTETVSQAQHGAFYRPNDRAAVAFEQNVSNTTTTTYLSSRSSGVSFSYGVKNTGFVLGTRIGTTTNVYKNSVLQATRTYSNLSPDGELNYYIGASNDRNQRKNYTTSEICFVTLGLGLTDQEAITYNSLVEEYQTTLGRQA